MDFVKAFIVGGAICVIGQLLIDLTKLTPARIMVLFVCSGVLLGALGIYERFFSHKKHRSIRGFRLKRKSNSTS